ncbi:uncharacterized protein LOC126329096 [Schistocerca gregaria]|uniref:uncharacterized protein LOC126329096 n=1 Tax=Schistocerca gregaria TaxID=7010 RepID=UPI00211E1AA2|nr:uncharacterized protein LOC126329096 [Schistocerca gregaria]
MGNPYIHILGPPANAESGSTGPRRLPIISFVVYHRSGKLLHYNFVCTLLNDLFGIQTRGGCVCAGPYGQHLLGIDLELAQLFEEQVDKYKDTEVLRPGFVRVCFNYFTEEEEVDYVIAAVNFVAREGWKLLPEYTFQIETNEWYHLSNRTLPGRRWLGEISYASGEMKYPRYEYLEKEVTTGEMSSYLDKAAEIVEDAERRAKAHHHFSELTQEQWLMREDAEALRWFVYPDEAYLVKIDIEEPSSDCLVGNAMNYHNPEWRERWASLCPLVPRYYAVSGMGESGERARLRYAATLVPKTDRSTAAIRGGSKSEEAAFGSVAGLCAMAQSPGDGDIGGVSPELPNELRGEDSSIIGAESADSDQRCAEPSGGTCSDGVAACRPGRASVKSLVEKRRAATAHSMRQSGNELLRQRRTSFWDEEKKSKLTRQHDPLQYTEYRVFKRMVAAIREFDLIQPGDRILVAVSGGKDSLTLLNMMLKARRHLPFKYEVAAITVDPQTLEYDPSPLKNYMAQLGIEYFYDSQPLISIAGEINPSSICSWCSRMKRGILHNACERYGYNVLALGQHLDDLVESFFMYSFHNGKLDTMKAATIVRDGRLKIIRPFVFVRERDTKDYANLSNLPVITENCPACFEEPKERSRIKALLKAQERLYPGLFGNLQSSIKPLMHPDLHLDKILLQLEASAKATKNQKYFPKQQDRP